MNEKLFKQGVGWIMWAVFLLGAGLSQSLGDIRNAWIFAVLAIIVITII